MEQEGLERVFAARGWLSTQPPDFRVRFLALGRLVNLERDQPTFHAGDAAGGVFGVVSGGVCVLASTAWQTPALAHILRAGDWFGHGPALRDGGRRTLTFVGAERSTLLQVPLERLRPQLLGDPDFAARIARMADVSTDTSNGVVRDLLTGDAARRVAAVLLRVTARGEVPPEDARGYPLTQVQIAEMANLSRHQANRVLGRLKRAGMIAIGYNRIRLLDVPALAAFAYGDG